MLKRNFFYPVLGLIIPGWGHAARGKVRQALLIQGSFYAALFTLAFSRLIVTAPGVYLFIFIAISAHIYSSINNIKNFNPPKDSKKSRLFLSLIFPLPSLSILLIVLLIKPYILGVQIYQVKSMSMKPTLHDGDVILVNTWRYYFSPPATGDIILFRDKSKRKFTYIKRIVQNPNGLSNSPEHGFYVRGDNRNHSIDSRHLGLIPLRSIKGRAEIILFNNTLKVSKLSNHQEAAY